MKFFVLNSVCILIDAENKVLTKHHDATDKMGYGCHPGLRIPNIDIPQRSESPWPEGVYEHVAAKQGERKPAIDFFSRNGDVVIRDYNDPYVRGQYITNGKSFSNNVYEVRSFDRN